VGPRRAPSHRSSATAHDVLLSSDPRRDQGRSGVDRAPVLACDDATVFGRRSTSWRASTGSRSARGSRRRGPRRQGPGRSRAGRRPGGHPRSTGWSAVWGTRAHRAVPRAADRAVDVAARVVRRSVAGGGGPSRPGSPTTSARSAAALAHGDYKLDNVLFAETAPPTCWRSSTGRWRRSATAGRPRRGR
jgi:hypothetical protein